MSEQLKLHTGYIVVKDQQFDVGEVVNWRNESYREDNDEDIYDDMIDAYRNLTDVIQDSLFDVSSDELSSGEYNVYEISYTDDDILFNYGCRCVEETIMGFTVISKVDFSLYNYQSGELEYSIYSHYDIKSDEDFLFAKTLFNVLTKGAYSVATNQNTHAMRKLLGE